MLPKIKKLVFEVEFQQADSPYQGRSPDIFFIKFNELKQSLLSNLQEFIPVDVVPRQPPPHFVPVTSRLNRHAYLDTKKNKLVQFPRKNSFQIYVDNFHLFSRLETATWPDTNAICEWALRVAEKIVDMEIEKEEGPLKDQLQFMGADVIVEEAPTQKLPPVSRGGTDQLVKRVEKSQLHNYYPRSRYSSLRQQDALLPYGVDPMNHTITHKMPSLGRSTKTRMKVKSIDKELRSTARNIDSGSREQSFHWSVKQKSKPASRYDALLNTFDGGKTPTVELSPLPALHDKVLDKQDETIQQVRTNAIELRLSQSALNCYRKYYRIEGNKVTKTSGDQLWSPILTETPLPLIGEYSFQIYVQYSAQRQVQLGIAPLNYYPQPQQAKPDILLSFNCGSGLIKDAKHNHFAVETKWREGGMKATQQPPFMLKASVNTKTKSIEWFINDVISASALLPSQYNTGFRAFVSLFNSRDAVFLNHAAEMQPKEQITGRERITTNAFVQTGDANQNQPGQGSKPLPLIQHRIYPNFKEKVKQAMIDEVTQTTPIIEGRIKKQRFHRFLQKEPQKEKIDFTIEDVQKYKTILANQSIPPNGNNYQPPKQQAKEQIRYARKQSPTQQPLRKPPKEEEHKPDNALNQWRQLKLNASTSGLAVISQSKENTHHISLTIIENSPTVHNLTANTPQQTQSHPQSIVQNHPESIVQNHPESIVQNHAQSIIQNHPQSIVQQQQPPLIIEEAAKERVDPQTSPMIEDVAIMVEDKLGEGKEDESMEISSAGEAVRWEGVYEEGSFKLKNTHT